MNPDPRSRFTELMDGLDQLQLSADQTVHAVREQTALIPASAEGSDPSGTVTVTLDENGWPTRVRVATGWPHRITPPEFAPAVTAACRAAHTARLIAWGDRLIHAREHGRSIPPPTRRTGPDGVGPVGRDAAEPAASDSALTGTAAAAGPRMLAELDRQLQGIARTATAAPGTTAVTGRTANGHLTVWISPDGVATCTADPDWVADQNAAALSTAATDAVHHARSHDDPTTESGPASQLDRIAEQAITTLQAARLRSAPDPGPECAATSSRESFYSPTPSRESYYSP